MKRYYGGAFDVEEDSFFTREDLDEFADAVAEDLSNMYEDSTFSVVASYVEDTVNLTIEMNLDMPIDEFISTATHKIDLRRITGNPVDSLIRAYKQLYVDDFSDEIYRTYEMY